MLFGLVAIPSWNNQTTPLYPQGAGASSPHDFVADLESSQNLGRVVYFRTITSDMPKRAIGNIK